MRRTIPGVDQAADILPVYDDVRNVDSPREGQRVHLTGSIQQPAGVWWYHDGRWFAGTRTRIDAQQESVGGNTSVTLQEFKLPTDTEIDVWQHQVTNIGGADDGLVMVTETSPSQNTWTEIAAYNGDDHAGEVVIGDPIATGGAGGEWIRIQARNTTGGQKTITGFVMISIQSTLT